MIMSSVRQGIAHIFASVRSGFAAHQFDPTGLHARHEPSGNSRIAHLYKSEHATPSVRYYKVVTSLLLDHNPPQLRYHCHHRYHHHRSQRREFPSRR
jgi:alpha-D-ribose 1-methylphosphonate 5-triphosphate diphosphatase PhnM